jgi:asparagine N-glycosylation enzyme membrane subunit Stt3
MALFGETRTAIHFGLLLLNAATIIVLFSLGRRLYDDLTGVVAGASFAILSLSQSVQGIFANAEHFVILPAVGGMLLLLRAIESDRPRLLFWSGLLLGLGFLMKQHGAAFIAFAVVYLLYYELRQRPVLWRRLGSRYTLLSIGAAGPFGLTFLVLLLAGVFQTFWFWTFVYAREYVTQVPFSMGLNNLKRQISEIVGSSLLLWIFAGIGLTALVWDRKARGRGMFVASFSIFSFLSICPGLYFRPHYFVLVLPAIALLAGIGVRSVGRLLKSNSLTVKRGVPILLGVIALSDSVYRQRVFLLELSPSMVSKTTYPREPFPESLEIARYIKEQTSRNDRIAVIGSEPQIYFYSGRRSASGYIYMYPLMERHRYALRMQQEMIREIESAEPVFLIVVYIPTSWGVRLGSETLILKWFEQYRLKYFYQVGVVDILSREATVYKWGDESIGYSPLSRYRIHIFKRKV